MSMISNNEPELIAYSLAQDTTMPLVRAPSSRFWMLQTTDAFAKRCLPLTIANQAGWFLLNTHTCRITWNGGDADTDIIIESPDGHKDSILPIQSHFGFGIITWKIPYLFRTSPGYNLLVRGPANWPKQDCYPLEGLVETDWATSPFTMNWKVTRPNTTLLFEKEEPICMLVPQRRHELEQIRPSLRSLDASPELAQVYDHWAATYDSFTLNNKADHQHTKISSDRFLKHYLSGITTTDVRAADHQTKLRLRDFAENES